jgi:hypothetical protein
VDCIRGANKILLEPHHLQEQFSSANPIPLLAPHFAPDAQLLDSTGLSIEAVVERVISLGRERNLWR